MSVSKKVIADHWEVNEEDVKCSTCEYWSKNEPNYCIFWDLHDEDVGGYCSFWSEKRGTKWSEKLQEEK